MDSEKNSRNIKSAAPTARPDKSPRAHRKESRQILAIAAAALVMLIIWGICALAGSLLKVKKIEVLGSSPYSYSEVVAVSGISVGDRANKIDRGEAERQIMRKLSYISKVKIRSGLFGRVKITLSSDKAAYYALIAGEYYSLSEEFRLLEKNDSKIAYKSGGLIYISLPKIKRAILGEKLLFYDEKSDYVELFMEDLKDSEILPDVRAVKLENRYEIEITYKKFTVKIGAYKDLKTKLNLARNMSEDQVLISVESAILDVSDPANATIRLK